MFLSAEHRVKPQFAYVYKHFSSSGSVSNLVLHIPQNSVVSNDDGWKPRNPLNLNRTTATTTSTLTTTETTTNQRLGVRLHLLECSLHTNKHLHPKIKQQKYRSRLLVINPPLFHPSSRFGTFLQPPSSFVRHGFLRSDPFGEAAFRKPNCQIYFVCFDFLLSLFLFISLY